MTPLICLLLRQTEILTGSYDIKFRKALRLATQAKACGAYLTYADLGYLLGIHPVAISKLIKANPKIVVPLRGASCDIGRGITHRRNIIKLYLEMHTETSNSFKNRTLL